MELAQSCKDQDQDEAGVRGLDFDLRGAARGHLSTTNTSRRREGDRGGSKSSIDGMIHLRE